MLSPRLSIVGTWSDDTKAINAGAAYFFHIENDGTWKQNKKIQAFKNENNQQVDDQQKDAHFGTSVAILGSWAVVGAPNYNSDFTQVKDSGAVYIFQLENHTWTGHSKIRLDFPEEDDHFGGSVGISGEWIIVGAENKKVDSIVNAGAAYLFHLDKNKTWKRHSRIEASDKRSNNTFGWSVAIAVNWAIVGAIGSDPDSLSMGAAYLFYRESDNQWREYSKLESSEPALFDMFGSSVAIDDHNAIVGAPEYSEKNTEAVYIFSKSPKGSIFLNQSTGNIGINTDTPSNSLTIAHPDNANQMLLEGKWQDSLDNNARINFIDNNNGIGAGQSGSVNGSVLTLWSYNGSGRGILFASTGEGSTKKFSEMTHNMFIAGDTGYVGIGANKPLAPLSIETGKGKETHPNNVMHITNDCILFGGNNNSNIGRKTCRKFTQYRWDVIKDKCYRQKGKCMG